MGLSSKLVRIFYSLAFSSFLFVSSAKTTPNLSLEHQGLINSTFSEELFKRLPQNPNSFTFGDGRYYPIVPEKPEEIAELLSFLEEIIHDKNFPNHLLPRIAHQQQVIYRVLSTNVELARKVAYFLPLKWSKVAERHIQARKEFLKMSQGNSRPKLLPAWKIIRPLSPEKLLSYYKKAERSTGIEWEILAAINLVETGMGRISGVSVANAQGPMQFLETTWNLPGIGNGGDINEPHDAIQAAARYLVRRGGLKNIRAGLWGYNNSDYYGEGVLQYAALLKTNPLSFRGIYNWEIHFNGDIGDIWLPVGYSQKKTIPISSYLDKFPASAPPFYSPIN